MIKKYYSPASWATSLKSVPWISTAMPTRALLIASLDEAKIIFCLIFAESGDLQSMGSDPSRQLISPKNAGLRISPYYADRYKRAICISIADRNLPLIEDQLVSLPSIFLLELKIVNCPSALRLWKVVQEIIVFP